MSISKTEQVVRGWFLIRVDYDGDLGAIVRCAWFELDQIYARSQDTFITRADVVESLGDTAGYNVIAPATAPNEDALTALAEQFAEVLSSAANRAAQIDITIALVREHTPNPPHNNAPGLIAEDEQLSKVGKLRDNPWG